MTPDPDKPSASDRTVHRAQGRLPLEIRVFLLTLLSLGLGFGAFIAWVLVRESAWPWTDFAAPYAVLHVVNESDHPVKAGWRWGDRDWWVAVRQDRRSSDGTRPHSSDFGYIAPLLPSEVLERPITTENDFWPAPGYTKQVVVRVDGDTFGSVEHTITVGLHDHLQLRIAPDDSVLFATGGESWIGYPSFGDEVRLPTR